MKLIKYLLSVAVTAAAAGALCICACGQESEATVEVTQAVTTVTEFFSDTSAAETSGFETTVSLTAAEGSEALTSVRSEESEDGWNLIDGRWFYYSEGIPARGTVEIDGEAYLFAPNGALKAGWQTINSLRIYVDYETHNPVYGWIDYMDNTYYCDKQSGKLTGMHSIDGHTYIFNEKGILQTGFIKYGGYMYYGDETGAVIKGDYDKSLIEIAGCEYIISPAGRVQLGWQTINGLRIYFDYKTAKPVYGWINYNGKYYYTDDETGKYTGERYINNHPYKFDEKGILQTGFQTLKNGKTCYYYENGTWAEGFITTGDATYYFDSDGYMTTGWKTINKKKYYFAENGKMSTGMVKISKHNYYFSSKGIMQTGFNKVGSQTYYFGTDGKMRYNWQTIDKNKYYFGSDGIMRTGWRTINKNKYYFGSDGIMKTGWQTIDKNKYYLGSDGIMQTGLKIINGKYCNLGDNGALKPIKVFVGVGHGGYDPGAIGYIVEKEYTLKTAKVVEEYLKAAGIEYKLSRDADIDTTMQSKLKLCNDYDPDLIIDIHFNAAGGNGFEIYHSMYGGMSKTLAENINKEVSEIMYSKGCKTFINAEGKDRFTIIRETHAPSVLIEGGYVDDWGDAKFIKSNYEKLGRAYAEGILKTILMMFG